MAAVNLIKSCIDSITQISEDIEGAIVYLDAGVTESFQFIEAYPVLLELGARAVCSLENMTALDVVGDWNSSSDPARKLVVVTSRLLSDAHRYILRCLTTHQVVRHCIIFTSISEMAHSVFPDSPLGPGAYSDYGSLLVQDYEELNKKSGKKPRQIGSMLQEKLNFEDGGRSQFPSTGEDVPHLEASSSGRDFYEHNPLDLIADTVHELVVSVHHFPMILCPISPKAFVLPSEGLVAESYLSAKHEDSITPGLPPFSTGLISDTDDVPPGATLTAHFLYHLAAKMDLKMEIFSLGDMSKTVGKILTDMSSLYDIGRRKRSVGLLLIDRTLDLLTPCCHGDSLIDRIFSALPRRERTTSHILGKGSGSQLKHGSSYLQRAPLDVQIPLAKIFNEEDWKLDNFRLLESVEAFLCGWNYGDSDSQVADLINLRQKIYDKPSHSGVDILTGSFVSSDNFRGVPFLEAILDEETKRGAVLVKKWLQEAMRRENVTVNVKSRSSVVTTLELQAMIKALSKSQSSLLRNKGIILLASATLSALEESNCTKWDAFSSAVKTLSVSSGETSQSLAAQIGDLINQSALLGSHINKGKKDISKGLISLQDALLLMIIGYILAGQNFPTAGSDGPFSWQEERLLKEAVVDALLENSSVVNLKFLDGLKKELEANISKSKSEEATEELEIDDFDDDQWGKWGDEDGEDDNKNEQVYGDMQLKLELRDRVDNFFKFLHKLSNLKRKNLPLRDGSLTAESVALAVDNPEMFNRIAKAFDLKASMRFVILLWGEKSCLVNEGSKEVPIFTFTEIRHLGRESRRLFESHDARKHYVFEAIKSDDIATLVYTSGTTGNPKGVMLTHQNLLHQIKFYSDIVPAEVGDRFLSMLPPWHAYERACEYFIFSCGVDQVYTTVRNLKDDLGRYQPHYLISVPLVYESLYSGIQRQISTSSLVRKLVALAFIRVSLGYMECKRIYEGKCLTKNQKSPSYLYAMLDWLGARIIATILFPIHMLAKKLVYSKIHSAIGFSKAGISGGGSLPSHVDRFFEAIGVTLQNGYGLTETSPVIAARRLSCNVIGSVGHPLKHTEFEVVDSETGEVLPPGYKGILKVRGPQLMKGYYKNPSATNQVIDRDGWLNTGDIGWIAAYHSSGRSRNCGGLIVVEGRAKDTIVLSSGENVEPGELEEDAMRSSLIQQIVVIGQDKRRLGAVVVPNKEEVLKAARELSIIDSNSSDLSQEKVTSLIYDELRTWTSEFPFQIGPILLVNDPFTIDNGLLTPTMKIRRDRVMAQYKDQIENLYK